MFDYLARDRRRLRRGTRAFTREVDAGQARVFVDHGFQWDGAKNVWLTRARASFVMQAGPRFDIRPRGFVSRVLGIQPGVSSGDPCFDDFFVVRTEQPEPTWSALTTRARSLLAGSFEDARLLSSGRMVTLWREGDFGREADADAAAEVVAEIVHFGCQALDALRRLPGAVYEEPDGSWDDRGPPAVELRAPSPVRLGPVAAGGRAVMSATADCGRATRRFRVEIDGAGRVRGDEQRFPASIAAAIPDVGPSTIVCDGARIALRWRTLETRRHRLLAGARIIGGFAASSKSSGVYR